MLQFLTLLKMNFAFSNIFRQRNTEEMAKFPYYGAFQEYEKSFPNKSGTKD